MPFKTWNFCCDFFSSINIECRHTSTLLLRALSDGHQCSNFQWQSYYRFIWYETKCDEMTFLIDRVERLFNYIVIKFQWNLEFVCLTNNETSENGAAENCDDVGFWQTIQLWHEKEVQTRECIFHWVCAIKYIHWKCLCAFMRDGKFKMYACTHCQTRFIEPLALILCVYMTADRGWGCLSNAIFRINIL